MESEQGNVVELAHSPSGSVDASGLTDVSATTSLLTRTRTFWKSSFEGPSICRLSTSTSFQIATTCTYAYLIAPNHQEASWSIDGDNLCYEGTYFFSRVDVGHAHLASVDGVFQTRGRCTASSGCYDAQVNAIVGADNDNRPGLKLGITMPVFADRLRDIQYLVFFWTHPQDQKRRAAGFNKYTELRVSILATAPFCSLSLRHHLPELHCVWLPRS